MTISKPELVMFDLNWVVEDTSNLSIHVQSFLSQFLQREGYDTTRDSYRLMQLSPAYGSAPTSEHYAFWRNLLSRVRGVRPKDVLFEEVDYLFREYLARYAPSSALYPDVVNLLRLLRKNGSTVALATNGNALRVHSFLAQHDLYKLLDIVTISGELPQGKPSPTFFESVLSEARVMPWKAIMVGDRPDADIAGADSCGIWTCQVSRPGCNRYVNAAVAEAPDFEINDLSSFSSIGLPDTPVATLNNVILLAGGKGARMGASDVAKVLMDFGNGLNALEWHLRMWESFGVKRIVVVLGPGAKGVNEYLALRAKGNGEIVAISANENGTARALKLAEDYFTEDSIVAHADILYEPRLVSRVVKCSLKFPGSAVLAICDGRVAPTHAALVLGTTGMAAKGFVFPEQKGDFAWSLPVSLGLTVLPRSCLRYMCSGGADDMVEHGVDRWKRDATEGVRTVRYSGEVCHIVYRDDLSSAARFTGAVCPQIENQISGAKFGTE